ncbi:guanine deaminase [Pseudobacteriovorax antillogorgiicola]|uniref:Guanine deaminase n=2 Tax=Pseudobacteriovorax antillogorgiicola TaxID=1513793 RepID=A0A1Y6BIN2_9BACT|nr:guanine deaminase [Pseudobacteriovorax antillogorgiicola]TCS57300.1 guanine deaminase [Pseudobacteriovorax antillogorgiicola]SMF02942.1 guanine deaminase [Pseudobacteriovorax antillogorgiicola]
MKLTLKHVWMMVMISVLSAPSFAKTKRFRASILHFVNDPAKVEKVESSYEYFEDGLLTVRNGKVVSVEPYSRKVHGRRGVKDYRGKLIVPGFVDTHIHFPQTEMIAAYGEQLLEWLETYTFPTEKQFEDKAYADKIAKFFLEQLVSNGTTTALVFGTVHPQSVDALFEAAETINMRLVAGKVMMNRNAPNYLLDTAKSSYDDSKALIQKWHGKGRNLYAITPRFAPTSTPEQLTLAGKLKAEFPDVYVHTHLSENLNEIEWVKSLFPERAGYLDVYDHYGLTGDKSVFAHSIHLTDDEWATFAETDSVISFCPTSNLFLGSGLFKLHVAEKNGVRVGLGTDVGAGTSFNQLQTLNEAYKIMQLQGKKLSAFKGLYLATLGGAESLSIDHLIGNFKEDKEADFVVLNWDATKLQKLRMSRSTTLEDRLFALMMLGDDRNIEATYVDGRKVFQK